MDTRFRGAMVGLAVGDAVGTTLEFQPPGTFTPLSDMQGGGPFELPLGAWTDDTSMALCLAESLIACQGFDPTDQMQRYLRWWRAGYLSSIGHCFDIGTTTSAALNRFERSGDPYSGDPDPSRAGNGSLMRLAPVVLFFASTPEQAITYAGFSSRTTHAAPQAIDACRYYAALILGALRGASKSELLQPHYTPVAGLWEREPLHPAIAEVAAGSFAQRQPPQIVGSGYVVRSLEAALWAFASTDSFEAGCLAAANLGNDADTTAAIYGQLAGAFYGHAAIPARWREHVFWHTRLLNWADQLWQHGGAASER